MITLLQLILSNVNRHLMSHVAVFASCLLSFMFFIPILTVAVIKNSGLGLKFDLLQAAQIHLTQSFVFILS